MKNNLEDKNTHKSLTFNQFLLWAKDTSSSLVDFCEGPWADTKNWIIRPLRHVIQKVDNLLEVL